MSKGMVRLTIAVAVLVAVLGAGCGGGSDEEASLTKAEFVKRADAICAKAAEEKEAVIAEASEKLPENVSDAVKEKVILEALAPYEKATHKVAELSPPDGQEKKVDAVVEAMEEGAERIQASPTSVLVSDLPVRKANKTAEAYGLKTCRF